MKVFSKRLFCGERGIRTPGGVTLSGFQDRRNRPLCHLSNNWGIVSGQQDSNLRPSAPKADTLTGLRYAPNLKKTMTYKQKSGE